MPHRIIYIEDDPAIIELVHDCLAHPDIDLIAASDVNEGLRKMEATIPDLVMLDVYMPERDGWTVYHQLRSGGKHKAVPIIMLTGQMHRYKIKKDFDSSPIDAYITKPFDVMAIRDAIESMLGKPIWSKGTPFHQLVASDEDAARLTTPAKRRRKGR